MAKLDETVKIVMLKGEKGDTGNPTDEEILTQVNVWLVANTSILTDQAQETATEETRKYLEENPSAIIDALNHYDGLWDADGGYAFSDLSDYNNDFDGGYPS